MGKNDLWTDEGRGRMEERGREKEGERMETKTRSKEGNGREEKGWKGEGRKTYFSLERKEFEELHGNVLMFLGE